MPRYKLTIEYDGTEFVGWQSQANGPSIQQSLETAILKFSGASVTVQGSGRTDAGVHAKGQVAHFDLERDFKAIQVQKAINFYLKPLAISVIKAECVSDDFHARFSTKKRAYVYRILNRPAPPALEVNRVWWVPIPLDEGKMQDAAQAFVGNHDFTTFRATHCQGASPVKTIDQISVTQVGEILEVKVEARSFLHHQVRNFVGTLKLVGEGKWSREDVEKALAAKDRAKGGPTAPACGLYFLEVFY